MATAGTFILLLCCLSFASAVEYHLNPLARHCTSEYAGEGDLMVASFAFTPVQDVGVTISEPSGTQLFARSQVSCCGVSFLYHCIPPVFGCNPPLMLVRL
jgi:hypothetical protein